MADETVFLVTGVSNYWGARLAGRLLQEVGLRVIGIDAVAPKEEIPGLDFILVDSRNPLLAELLRSESVAALCHLDFTASAEIDDQVSQHNLSAAMNVLDACAEAGVQRVVVKSSTAVYGARPDNSAFLDEQSALRGSGDYGYTRDLLKIEAYCNGYCGQWPGVGLTVLRLANIIGARANTPMTQFLSLPTPPILLGFDPMMQLLHEDDAVEALAYAMLRDRPGVFNVAAEDAMPLSRILRLAHRVPLPIFHVFAYPGMKALKEIGLAAGRVVPVEWDYLRYSLVADLSRMREELVFSPIYTAAESLREFASQRAADDDNGPKMTGDEAWLRAIIDRRQRENERRAGAQRVTETE
ncbi:MAG: NAD-dependent epimerase/dehydratase family protein [Chloroflexota bacterium]